MRNRERRKTHDNSFVGIKRNRLSVTRKKSPNVYKSWPKVISLEK